MSPYGYGMGGMPVGPYRDFDALVMPKFGQMAGVCVKCASPQCAAYPRKSFTFTPPWVWVVFFISPLIGLIMSAVVRKSAALNVPLCHGCNEEWKKGNRNLGFSFGVGLSLFLVGIGLCAAELENIGAPLLGFSVLALIIAPVIVQFAYRRQRTLWARKIDDRSVWLMGVHGLAIEATCMRQNTAPMMDPALSGPPMQSYTPPHLMG
jgi:hypothetical protein